MRHAYRVDLTMHVWSPACGPIAYWNDTKHKEFSFGKNGTYKTGKLALEAATNFAKSMLDESSSVSIWRLSIGKHDSSGTGEYLKDDDNSLFAFGWDDTMDA